MFDRLKQQEPEPVLDEAMAIGTDRDAGDVDETVPREILLQMPGVTVHNVRKITNNVENLLELTRMTMEEIASLLGTNSARRLYNFLHQTIKLASVV
mmetsp:Transcript_3019/g.7041  ORF Transcript_3019/g.7041 Transcript_3019/m.7041 type:complete len:97 (+) Transcript_3019:1501-1791(+)